MRGRRRVDCIGRMVRRPSDWEIASQFAVVFEAIKQLNRAADSSKEPDWISCLRKLTFRLPSAFPFASPASTVDGLRGERIPNSEFRIS